MNNQSKFVDTEGVLRYSDDASRVLLGRTGVPTRYATHAGKVVGAEETGEACECPDSGSDVRERPLSPPMSGTAEICNRCGGLVGTATTLDLDRGPQAGRDDV